jgi:hypothetical protein
MTEAENRYRKPSLAAAFQFAGSWALVNGAFIPEEKLSKIVEELDRVVVGILDYLQRHGLKNIYDTTKELYEKSKKQEKIVGRYMALMMACIYSVPFLLTVVEAISQYTGE